MRAGEAVGRATLLTACDGDEPAPVVAADVTTNDQRDEPPSSRVGRQHVEVVPLAPAFAIGDVGRRKVKVVNVLIQLVTRGSDPPTIARVILPRTGNNGGKGAPRGRARRDFSRGAHRVLSLARTQIQQLSVDLWCGSRDLT